MAGENDFTRSLLSYSAERDDCIGRPERWGVPPPLVVDSPLHRELTGFADEIWNSPPRLIWHFLIGGPGNGKSEAVGAFVRRLNTNAVAAGQSEIFKAENGEHGGRVAYWFAGKVPGGNILLLQDVSVPKSSGSDPSQDLLLTLDLCANDGSHLVACANRGMLLRATRAARSNPSYTWLLPTLEEIDRQSQEASAANGANWSVNLNGKEIEIRVWPLDHESVLLGESAGNPWSDPSGSILDQIVKKAIEPEKWEHNGCAQCPAKRFCPMFGDAVWLRDDKRRNAALRILRYAEVWSGQRIVLREALGLVSTILVGCPSDFVEGTSELHPCQWVRKRIQPSGDGPISDRALLELLSKRIYQDLFGRISPSGLSLDRRDHYRDRWIVQRFNSLGSVGEAVGTAIEAVDDAFAKHTGPLRLVGPEGILAPFDPALDYAWCLRHSISPDCDVESFAAIASAHSCMLETGLKELLQRLEQAAQTLPPHNDPAQAFAAIYRWASTLFLRLLGTALGETSQAEHLANYLLLLQQPSHAIDALGKQTTLRELMKAVAMSGNQWEPAPGFSADIQAGVLKAVGARPRSNSPRWPANDRLLLQTGATAVFITARTFVDTWRRYALGIAEWNISPAMDKLMRAWRESSIISSGQFRELQTVEYHGKSALEFEVPAPDQVQVRPK